MNKNIHTLDIERGRSGRSVRSRRATITEHKAENGGSNMPQTEKNVWISIKGVQHVDGESDTIELSTVGKMERTERRLSPDL